MTIPLMMNTIIDSVQIIICFKLCPIINFYASLWHLEWTSSWKRLIYVWWTRYNVEKINLRWFPRYIVEINLFHDDFHAITFPRWSRRGWKISVYLFRRVFRDGAIVERINFRDRIMGNVKKARCSLCR
jgi:hypothetical protein